MAYFKKVQRKVNGKWYPQGVTIGNPFQTKEVANRWRIYPPSAFWWLLLGIGKSLQDTGRNYERRTHSKVGRQGDILLHAEHAGAKRGYGGRSQREADNWHTSASSPKRPMSATIRLRPARWWVKTRFGRNCRWIRPPLRREAEKQELGVMVRMAKDKPKTFPQVRPRSWLGGWCKRKPNK